MPTDGRQGVQAANQRGGWQAGRKHDRRINISLVNIISIVIPPLMPLFVPVPQRSAPLLTFCVLRCPRVLHSLVFAFSFPVLV